MWPISSTVVRAGIACRELIYIAPISASAADVIMFLIICAMVKTARFCSGFAALFDMKKCQPALLLSFGLVRYDASLCAARTMFLVLKKRLEFRV